MVIKRYENKLVIWLLRWYLKNVINEIFKCNFFINFFNEFDNFFIKVIKLKFLIKKCWKKIGENLFITYVWK